MPEETQTERSMAERHEWVRPDGSIYEVVREGVTPRAASDVVVTSGLTVGAELLRVVAERDEARARVTQLEEENAKLARKLIMPKVKQGFYLFGADAEDEAGEQPEEAPDAR